MWYVSNITSPAAIRVQTSLWGYVFEQGKTKQYDLLWVKNALKKRLTIYFCTGRTDEDHKLLGPRRRAQAVTSKKAKLQVIL